MKMILFLLSIAGSINCVWDHEQAIVLAQKGNVKEALQSIDTLLVDDPFNSNLLYDAGVLAYKNKQYQQALHYFQQAAQYVPKQLPLKEHIHFNAGNAQVKNNALEIAVDEYKKVLKINPGNEKAAHNLKKVEEMLKKQQEEQKNQEKNNQNEQKPNQDDASQNHQDDDQDNQKNNDQKNDEDQDDKGNKQQQQSNNQDNADQKGSDTKQKNAEKDGQHQKDRSGNKQDAENPEQENNTKNDTKNDESRRNNTDKKESEQKDQQKSGANDASDTQEKNDAAQPTEDEHQEQKAPALNPQLARVVQEHGDADANLNKQFIKLIVDQQAKRNNDGPQW